MSALFRLKMVISKNQGETLLDYLIGHKAKLKNSVLG